MAPKKHLGACFQLFRRSSVYWVLGVSKCGRVLFGQKNGFYIRNPPIVLKSFLVQNIKLGSSWVSHLNKQEMKCLVIFQEYELDFKTRIRNGHILCFPCYMKVLYHIIKFMKLHYHDKLNEIINNISNYKKYNYISNTQIFLACWFTTIITVIKK